MQIGLFNGFVLADASQRPEDVMAMTREMVGRADDLGFDTAWFVEHHFSAFSLCASPVLMAMHCAGYTKRIRLGTGVIVMPLHHPLRVVEEIGMLDQASGGRAVVGIGTGHQPHEFRSMGVGMDERLGRLFEGWDILRASWRDGRIAHKGTYYEIPETVFAVRPVGGRVPELFVATHDTRVMARGAVDGAVVFISPGPRKLEQAMAARAEVMHAAAGAGVAEADVKLGVQRYCFVTESKDVARKAAEQMVHFMRRMRILREEFPPRQGIHFESVPFPGEPSVEWLLEHAAIGDAETVAERLLPDIPALRPHHLSIYMGYSWLPAREVLRSLDLFGAHVLPRLRAAGTALG
jgi:alkanesulfonate monooxygenase SsuD/methylene tetrahydromethanopterin reductase-like flavin-dependent oxidoreductase (luciferase family)